MANPIIPGNLYSYTSPSWCVHGLALVAKDGRAWDTYWGEGGSMLRGPIEPEKLTAASLIGNLSEFTTDVNYPFTYWDYSDTDHLFIPVGGRSECRLVRIGAKPLAELFSARMQSEINSAERKVVTRKQELESGLAEIGGAQ